MEQAIDEREVPHLCLPGLTETDRYQARIVARNKYGIGAARLFSVVPPLAPVLPPPPPLVFQPPLAPSVDSIRVLVAVPSDGTAYPPLAPAVVHELGLVSDWFASQTGGRRPRFVGAGGVGGLVPEVSTVVLPRTRAQLEGALDVLEATTAALAEVVPRTPADRVFVYADVAAPRACGVTSAYNETVFLWMPACNIVPSEVTSAVPFGATYLAMHEMTHMFGAVPACAPHSDGTGHVNDDPSDVLYVGAAAGLKNVLDPGHDDYYGHGRPNCMDIALSPLWQ